jgi:hypothetical protein
MNPVLAHMRKAIFVRLSRYPPRIHDETLSFWLYGPARNELLRRNS